METTQETNKLLKQKRSGIKSCIIESWKVFALNTTSFFKYLWLHLFIAGLGYALFSILFCKFYTEHIQSTLAYIEAGYDATLAKALFAPEISSYLVLIVAFLAFLFASYLLLGAIFSQIRFYKATDSLPAAGPFTFWSEIRKDGKKAFVYDIIILLAVGIISCMISLLAWLTSWWVLLLLLPVVIYAAVIGMNGRLQYIVEGKPLKQALKDAFTVGHYKFGGYFILLLLTSIPFFIISYVAFLPGTIIQLSYSTDMISKLAGDPSGIPPYVLPMYLVLSVIGFSFFSVAYTLQQWPLALFTSAVSNLKKNK